MRRSSALILSLALATCIAATVSVKELKFTPGTVSIRAGQSVTWKNNDSRDYTVTAANGSFDSGTLKPGKSYTHTFSSTGRYPYGSKLHPRTTGTVVVK
ncbi:MAG: cupredoxin domain-containing protein [Planctomycetota bacterium]